MKCMAYNLRRADRIVPEWKVRKVREQWAMQEPLPLKRPPGARWGCYPTPESPFQRHRITRLSNSDTQNHNTMSYAKGLIEGEG